MLNRLFIIFCLLSVVSFSAWAAEHPLADPDEEVRAYALFHQIRCTVCMGQSIAESPADAAADMRQTIRVRVAAGDSDTVVEEYMVTRYGDAIMMRPPINMANAILWGGPMIMLIAAMFVIWLSIDGKLTKISDKVFRISLTFTKNIMMLYSILCALLPASLAVMLAPLCKAGAVPENQRKRFILALSAFFIIGASGLYYWLGSPEIVPLMAARQEKLAALKETIVRRSEDVKANPKNLGAWIDLGQSFMETDQFSAAANAFKQSVVLSHGNPLLIMAYAQAMIFAADGKITDDAQKSLQMVLLQQPQNPEAHYYLAVRQLQDGHTQEAMKAMKELYQSLPADSPLKAMIDREIGRQ